MRSASAHRGGLAPTVGMGVHYVSEVTGKCRAATVTEVPDLLPEQPNTGPEDYVPSVHLAILAPTSMLWHLNVPYSEDQGDERTWHYCRDFGPCETR